MKTLSVRRVKIQTIDQNGNAAGSTYGILAMKGSQTLCRIFTTLEDMNETINKAKSILDVIDPKGTNFPTADDNKIGYNNYFGTDWEQEF